MAYFTQDGQNAQIVQSAKGVNMQIQKPLSTRQVAQYCQVNFKTVLKWIEEGKLKAYKLPDSGVNKIQSADLIDFLKRFDFPIPRGLQAGGIPRILIVDDEPVAVDTLRRLLRASEFEIEEAHDGFEAGRKVESFKPDVMLLDLKMPGMSGHDVLREIKQGENTRHIRVIILSGYVDAPQRSALIKSGAEGVLEKPIDRAKLLALIGVPGKQEVPS
jgi:excisionase family DNA binding protein